MISKLRRNKLHLTKRKQRKTHRVKTKRRLTRKGHMKIKRTRQFRKSRKQYGGKFNDFEIQQIRNILGDNKGFTEVEIDDFIRRINLISQDLSQRGEFEEMVVPQLIENDKRTLMDWLEFNERRLRDVEPMTDTGESDMGSYPSTQDSQEY